jgi:SAM-dependent methyltransferase
MKYVDLRSAYEVLARGGNVLEHLRASLGLAVNTSDVVEIAYDIRAGADIRYVAEHPDARAAYATELSEILARYVEPGDVVLEVGCGECTTLADAAASGLRRAGALLGCDLSWSRVFLGRGFLDDRLPRDAPRVELFVADLLALPLRDASVDVLWTAHTVESNGGREREALAELFRITRRRLCLFEPNYEAGTPEIRARMERFGWARGLPAAIEALGGTLESCLPMAHPVNPLNPTYAFIVRPPGAPPTAAPAADARWACPATRLPLAPLGDVMFCEGAGLAYPILRGIPVLRPDAAVLATALRRPDG